MRRFGLTRVGWYVLLAVAEEDKKNPSDIADFVGIDRTATSRALRVLETEGLIGREMGRDDRRTTEVKLTELGEEQFQEVLPVCRDANMHFHDKLSADELDTLMRLLAKLTEGETD